MKNPAILILRFAIIHPASFVKLIACNPFRLDYLCSIWVVLISIPVQVLTKRG